MEHCGQRGLRVGMEGGRKNVLGPGTRKRTWARSGRVEAGFKAERVRENGSYLWSISQCCRRCAGVCAGAQAPGRVEAAAGFKPNRSESKRRGKRPPEQQPVHLVAKRQMHEMHACRFKVIYFRAPREVFV